MIQVFQSVSETESYTEETKHNETLPVPTSEIVESQRPKENDTDRNKKDSEREKSDIKGGERTREVRT